MKQSLVLLTITCLLLSPVAATAGTYLFGPNRMVAWKPEGESGKNKMGSPNRSTYGLGPVGMPGSADYDIDVARRTKTGHSPDVEPNAYERAGLYWDGHDIMQGISAYANVPPSKTPSRTQATRSQTDPVKFTEAMSAAMRNGRDGLPGSPGYAADVERRRKAGKGPDVAPNTCERMGLFWNGSGVSQGTPMYGQAKGAVTPATVNNAQSDERARALERRIRQLEDEAMKDKAERETPPGVRYVR